MLSAPFPEVFCARTHAERSSLEDGGEWLLSSASRPPLPLRCLDTSSASTFHLLVPTSSARAAGERQLQPRTHHPHPPSPALKLRLVVCFVQHRPRPPGEEAVYKYPTRRGGTTSHGELWWCGNPPHTVFFNTRSRPLHVCCPPMYAALVCCPPMGRCCIPSLAPQWVLGCKGMQRLTL